jgi:hypothetical protein
MAAAALALMRFLKFAFRGVTPLGYIQVGWHCQLGNSLHAKVDMPGGLCAV